jgi:predicted CopG family antitoxin
MLGKNLKLIAVSTQNYLELKRRGQTADSFNDVITELLKISKSVTGDRPITGRTQQSPEIPTNRRLLH